MAKSKPAYDMGNSRDREIVQAAKEMGLPTKHRIGTRKEDALLAMTAQGRKRLKGVRVEHMEVALEHDGDKALASPVVQSTLAHCLWKLPADARYGVEEFAAVFLAAIPAETVSYGERAAATGAPDLHYDHKALDKYGEAKRGVGKKAAKLLEWAARLSDDALISQAQWFGLIQAGMRAKDFFDD
jgi:hypothetical protein